MILAIDQGTTSTRVIVFNLNGTIKYQHSEPITVSHPLHGYASINPNDLYNSVELCLKHAYEHHPDIQAVGLTNQRETTIFWTNDGHIFDDGIVWYDARTSDLVDKYTLKYGSSHLQSTTGLSFSTYFSALKIVWMIQNNSEIAEAYADKTLRLGTVDTFLLWKLTGEYKTDITNASRTMLMNLHSGEWDKSVLSLFGLENLVLPAIHASDAKFGTINIPYFKNALICGILGDQQAALVGQNCLQPGDCKCTYGTGCFLLMTTDKPIFSSKGLITTVAFELGGVRRYALEGAVNNVGSVISWFEKLDMFKNGVELDLLAQEVDSSDGVIFVPALAGLFAPYWQPNAKGVLINLTQATTKSHIGYALFESIAIQIKQVIEIMAKDAKLEIAQVKVDGGVCNSNLLMQIQSNMVQSPVLRPHMRETTALGCAIAAGISVGIYKLNGTLPVHYEYFLPGKYRKEIVEEWKESVALAIPTKKSRKWSLLEIGIVLSMINIAGIGAAKWWFK